MHYGERHLHTKQVSNKANMFNDYYVLVSLILNHSIISLIIKIKDLSFHL